MNKQRINEIDQQIAELEEKLKNVKGTPSECWNRIVGYFRSVNPEHLELNTWNKGKVEEYKNRKVFKINEKDFKENT